MTTLTHHAAPPCGKHLINKRLALRRSEGDPTTPPGQLAPTRIALAGAGGNGSQMVMCLARMDRALRALGLPGLAVTLYDPDRVSVSNVGRQLFYPDDVGQSKAVALVHRANLGFGLAWNAVPRAYEGRGEGREDILITCVDTGAARARIWERMLDENFRPAYWLDIGNEDDTGQVWLGEVPEAGLLFIPPERGPDTRLRCITEAFPEFFDGREPETDTPTCSLAEALRSQDLFVNDLVTRWGAHLVWTLLRFGELRHRGYWVNLRDGVVTPEPVAVLEAA